MLQLKVRTEYSFGKTFAPIPLVVKRLKEMSVTAAGIVDFSSTWGHVPWVKACKEAGIQPLLGVDLIVSDDEDEHRMWFLAKTTAGLSEMYRFTSKAHQQGVATKAGSLPRLYRNDVLKMSPEIAIFAGDIVDQDFLEDCGAILDLNPASRLLNNRKRAIASATKLQLVETSDNAYARLEDRATFELCSRAGTKVTPQHIVDVSTTPAMEAIAEACEDLELPRAPMITADGDLESVCRAGIKLRGLEGKWTKEYEDRLQYELELIRSKNFESYFIIVADMVRFAKEHMLVGPSRGSAAGSLVCYVSRIT
jgi:DNA polymerase III alpha subunit